MIEFLGYNFLRDTNTLDPFPTDANNLSTIDIWNGIYDNINITRNVKDAYSEELPTKWDYDTIFDANFEGDLNAGNIDASLEQITSVRIKRRIKGTFNWITLFDVPVSTVEDLKFEKYDFLNQHSVEYEYAFVPMTNNIEGNYITNTVMSELKGVFISDIKEIYGFYGNVSYGSTERANRVGVFEPYGSKYPVIVSNGDIDYESGSVQATVMTDEMVYENQFDEVDERILADNIARFLANKKAKILKDWNGNIWLITVTASPTKSYVQAMGNGLVIINFAWSEVGDPNNHDDLYITGVVDVEKA